MLALVLARKNRREFDQVVSFYTREQGKIEVLAKGIKKIISKNSSNLEILSLVEIEVANGKEIDHLTKVQPIKFFKNVYFDFDKIFLAGYAVKIIDEHTLAREADERIFNLLLSFLEFLDLAPQINSLNLAAGFIYKFWHCLGFSDVASAVWLEENWSQINNKLSADAYQRAHAFAEHHNSRPLAKFIENDRIMA